MTYTVQNYVFTDAGTAVVGATVDLMRSDNSAILATTTTNGAGFWQFLNQADLPGGVYPDVRVTNGSQIRWMKGGTQFSVLAFNTMSALSIGGALTISPTAAQVIPGATSLSLRNNANNADNFIVLDAGSATLRNALTISAGTPALTLPVQSGGVTKAITWGDNGGGTTSILGNTVGGAPSGCVLRFDVANGVGGTGTTALLLTGGGSAVAGLQSALSNGATDGFVYVPSGGGGPTGVPTTYGATIATRFSTADNKLYAYINGSWKASAAFA